MSITNIRTRFAPSPTGLMHLGSVRTALMNYLFAKQKHGTFLLRIEDTDAERNFDPGAKQILQDLHWLNLSFDEKPYFQSQRAPLYQKQLQILIDNNYAYRCFCTQEELEKKRARQITLKQPPRYDRTCLKRTDAEIAQLIANNTPYIWRMNLGTNQSIMITDLAHGQTTFDLNHFSDFSLTRQDGTVTFMFANCVDDIDMQITHIFRGEDHLTNTAGQAALFKAFNAPLPIYWHMPILCNIDGKKLSKRDFGFSLNDLQQAGFLPEAICNYVAIIGGRSFTNEIMSLDELANTLVFDHIHTSGQVKYDVEKLRWVNHKWINQYDPEKLRNVVKQHLEKQYPAITTLSAEKLDTLIQTVKTDVHTIDEFGNELAFYFTTPTITKSDLALHLPETSIDQILTLFQSHLEQIDTGDQFLNNIKLEAKTKNIPLKQVFTALRVALTGKPIGPGIDALITMLGTDEAKKRLEKLQNL